MKRLVLILMLTAACAFAEGDEGGEGGLQGWKWANFVLLAAGIGYLVGKNAGPFFSARSAAKSGSGRTALPLGSRNWL